ncbi:hypothetical protein KIN20_032183 [Parelaphostrongylus tenuis]|uniref:Tc1-like transposase DDE domain-containing protein n=1 Tax=Parelaphostrongylus tenuis TaxID=148309 RepID=A0AAD5R6M8_PARTN|nr:hypothetical protein KIN20_032183 [Parelaphostrongylus tenuis]
MLRIWSRLWSTESALRLLQQDNARPHTVQKVKDKFDEMEGVEFLSLPIYSPDAFNEVEEACQGFFKPKLKEW